MEKTKIEKTISCVKCGKIFPLNERGYLNISDLEDDKDISGVTGGYKWTGEFLCGKCMNKHLYHYNISKSET